MQSKLFNLAQKSRDVFALGRNAVVAVCLSACALPLSACQAPGPPILRQGWGRPQSHGDLVAPPESAIQQDAPRKETSPLKVAPPEPVIAAETETDAPSPIVESAEIDVGRPTGETRVSVPTATSDVKTSQGPRSREVARGEAAGEPTSGSGPRQEAAEKLVDTPTAAGAKPPVPPADDRQVSDDPRPKRNAAQEEQQGAPSVKRQEATEPAADGRGGRAQSAPGPLFPVIPARVEKMASTPSGEIVYPEAPPPIAVSREQVDALRLPSTDPKRPIIGIWEQVGGDNSADFAEGNYTRTVLVCRTDGVLEVVRWFGAAREIRLDSKLNYTVTTGDRIRLELPRGSSGANRRAYSIPLGDGMSVHVDPIQAEFPGSLTFTQNDGKIVIDGKTYRHVEPR